jgi:hypothetical protein
MSGEKTDPHMSYWASSGSTIVKSALSPFFYMLSFKRLYRESGQSFAPEDIKTVSNNKFQPKSVLQAPLRQKTLPL